MVVSSTIKMDLKNKSTFGAPPKIKVMQNDRYSRNIVFTLFDGGKEWEIPTDAEIIVRFVRKDGTGGNYSQMPDGTNAYEYENNSNVLTARLSPAVTIVPGPVQVSVGIIVDDQEINTFSVVVDVEHNPGLMATSEGYYKILGSLPDSGWEPNMYLGTDANGNVVTKVGSGGAAVGLMQAKSVAPTDEIQVVTPDAGYDGLSSVTVSAIASELITSALVDMDSGKYEEPIVDLEFYTYERDTTTIANRGVLGVAGNATVTLNNGSAYYKNNDGYENGIILTKNANFAVPSDLFENAITSVYTWIIKVENYVHQSSIPAYARICRSNKDVPSVFYYYARNAFCAKLAGNCTSTNVISYNPNIVTIQSDTGITFPIAFGDVLAFTCDGSVIRFYINGTEAISMLRSKMTVTDIANVGCGDTSNTSNYYFESLKISKFLLYNRCLTAEELQEVM